MRKIFYNSILAKIVLFVSSMTIVMLFGAICSKNGNKLSAAVKRHESTHCEQYWEVTLVAFLVAAVLSMIFGVSGWVFIVPFVYYILYAFEAMLTWAVRVVRQGWKAACDAAYSNSMFEQEAELAETDQNYNEHRSFWGFLRFFGKM